MHRVTHKYCAPSLFLETNTTIFTLTGWKFVGIFFGLKPVFMPLDLEIVKNILIKDFNHFTDRGEYINEKDDPICKYYTG